MEKRIKRLGKCFFLTLGVLGAASLTGCSEDVSALFGSDGTAVEVAASVADAAGAMTRAADGLNGSGFTLTTEGNSESKVRVMVDQNNGDYSQFDYNVTGATTINRDSKPTFPSGVNSVNVYGWYPAKSLENFTVAADQTGNNGYCLSDLLFAKGATCTRNSSTGEVENAASLTFNHVMAKVKVNLTLAEGVTVKSAKFKSMMRTVTVTATQSGNVVTGCSVGAASSAGDITLLTDGTLTNASSDADKLLCGVFPEQTKSGAFLEIVANYDGGSDQTITYSFDNSSSKTFGSGNEYLMNITLKGTDITTGTVSIANWSTAAGTVNIGGGALELAPTSLTMTYGDAAQTLTISGSVTIKSDGTTAFNVTSSDTDVATVSTTGTTVTVTPVSAGSTTITVTDANNDKNKATCSVTVNKAAASFSLSSSALTIGGLNTTKTFTVNRSGTGNDGTISCEVVNGTGMASVSDINQTTGVITVTGTTEGTATVKVSVGAGTNYEASISTQDVTVTIIADPGVALSSASAVVGMIVASNGKAYTTSNYNSSYGDKVAVIGYRSGSSGYAVALVDADKDSWNNITNSGANKNVDCTLADGKRGSVPVAPAGTTWKVLNKANYIAMWQAMGSAYTYNATSNKLITDAGGTALSDSYWSSQENHYTGHDGGWYFNSDGWDGYYDGKFNSYFVRPVLAW